MKHLTSELEGDALDYIVRCAIQGEKPFCTVEEWAACNDSGWHPSRVWEQGGPIIERARITLHCVGGRWGAWIRASDPMGWPEGLNEADKPLIAAMRAYVTSVFGEYVEIP